jgi:phage terminase large subunit-like protein
VSIPCYAGLDLGVIGDMSALVRSFPNDLGGLDFHPRFWVPREGRWQQEPHNKILYPLWEKEGWLIFTAGESTDFDQVEADILELNEITPFKSLTADRAYASMLLSRLYNTYGLNVSGISQGPVTLNEPMTRFEAMLLSGTARHPGSPVFDWNISNATVKTTSTGLMHLDKSQQTRRIDGLAAAINSVHGWLMDTGEPTDSVYNERGMLLL